ncbi:hypothetical protein L1987_29684 [Smallanthus sonchifolius]|uniref:Uncharacterized protein n=1 Tax=Smallanthus sonchifolius TaxID=185202 RepID=A0ACB9I2G7_9ASTR|nr:hypothetical protein L1987_29684 [Smallanthus sonchifolius]
MAGGGGGRGRWLGYYFLSLAPHRVIVAVERDNGDYPSNGISFHTNLLFSSTIVSSHLSNQLNKTTKNPIDHLY